VGEPGQHGRVLVVRMRSHVEHAAQDLEPAQLVRQFASIQGSRGRGWASASPEASATASADTTSAVSTPARPPGGGRVCGQAACRGVHERRGSGARGAVLPHGRGSSRVRPGRGREGTPRAWGHQAQGPVKIARPKAVPARSPHSSRRVRGPMFPENPGPWVRYPRPPAATTAPTRGARRCPTVMSSSSGCP
jgi:hypothetical protein